MKPTKESTLKKTTPAQTKRYRDDVAKDVAEDGDSSKTDAMLLHGFYILA